MIFCWNLLCVLTFLLNFSNVYSQSITIKFPDHICVANNEEKDCRMTSKRYHFITMFKANFYKAHHYCRAHDMELLVIESKEEEIAFLNLLNNKDFEYKQAKDFWTSGTDLGSEGSFFYLSTGKSVEPFLSWARDEPNNARRTDTKSSLETENCMAYIMTDNLKFYRLFDRHCSTHFNFICQDIQSRRIKSAPHIKC